MTFVTWLRAQKPALEADDPPCPSTSSFAVWTMERDARPAAALLCAMWVVYLNFLCKLHLRSINSDLKSESVRHKTQSVSHHVDAKHLGQRASTETDNTCKRIRWVKRFQDELVSDESLADTRFKFKVETLFCLVDTFFQQISNRFADFWQHVSKFFVLDTK